MEECYDVTFLVCKRTGHEKSVQQLTQPDERILSYGSLTPEDVQACYLEAEKRLSNNVPDKVREHLILARKLGAYGYFQWEFFTVSLFWSLTAIEMALRHKFQNFNDNFRDLMNRAVKERLIPDDIRICLQELEHSFINDFPTGDEFPKKAKQKGKLNENPSWGDISKCWNSMTVEERQNLLPPRTKILAKEIPNLRNKLAHPGTYSIMLWPRSAIDGYLQAIEVVNCLWETRKKV